MFIIDAATFRSIRPSSGLEYSSCFNDRHFQNGEDSRLSVGAGVVGVGSGFSSL